MCFECIRVKWAAETIRLFNAALHIQQHILKFTMNEFVWLIR